jgi:predicted Ser/Thr protein kinase
VESDLFSNVSGKFDTIIFNPPYLPQDKGIEDAALYGGKKGWELSERFFNEASGFLKYGGVILFLFSSYTDKRKVDELISSNLLESTLLASRKFAFFEELFVYKVVKSRLLRELEQKKVKQIHFLARGKRGLVFSGKLGKQKVAMKTNNPNSEAVGKIDNEARWLKILNRKNIGPKFYFSGKDYVVMGFVEGDLFDSWIKKHTKAEIIAVLVSLLGQCLVMDRLGMSKEEMHRPFKHIIINCQNLPVMIDFERCHYTDRPGNVTQFLEYLCRMSKLLKEKVIDIDRDALRNLARNYRQSEGLDDRQKILQYISNYIQQKC